MRAEGLCPQRSALDCDCYPSGTSTRVLEDDEMGNRSLGWCATEGAILEIPMTLRVVVAMMGRLTTGVCRAKLQQERSAARRHESHGDVSTK
jgi:hypothetical protein